MVKWLSEVKASDIIDANRIEAMTFDDKSAPKTIWTCHGKLPEERKGPGQPFPRGNTLVVRLDSEQELPKLKSLISAAVGRDIIECVDDD
jgi:hypothetical protein